MKRIAVITAALLTAGVAHAQEDDTVEDRRDYVGFVEGMVGYGFQFGTTPYVPEGDGTEFKHPLTNGPALGGTGGLQIVRGIDAILNYELTLAQSRSGEITNAVRDIQGSLAYNTITAGLRTGRWLGPGRLIAEFGMGVVLPFSTQLEYDYDPALSQIGIEGSGRRIDEYALGFGGQGAVGYQIDLTKTGLFAGSQIGIKSFTSTRDGQVTRFENFVPDFTAAPPAPVNDRIAYDADGGVQPTTFSVQDVRAQLVLGTRFF